MKISARLMIIGLTLLTLFSGTLVCFAKTVNLLSNGGFEDELTGWNPDPQHSLVAKTGIAHSGNACLTGEVTKPNQSLRLRRKVRVHARNLYKFEIWARATNHTKLVLWVRQPGAKNRQFIAAWKNVPPKWRRFTTSLSAHKDGILELQIISPSSFGAPAGRMWLDDIALYETAMPPLTSVSKGIGFNDEPTMAKVSDGSIYVAWNSFRDGADSLQVARYERQNTNFKQLGNWQILGGKGSYILGVRAVPAGQNAIVLYAAERDKDWNIYAVTCGAEGPGRPITIGWDSDVDIKPAGAWHDGTLWVAWESNHNGSRQIFVASVRDGKVSKPMQVSTVDSSNYGPSVAILQDGEVCVAWHSFRQNNYDVFLRRRTLDGSWTDETRLTRALSIDRHPVLIARGNELWIIYENAQTKGYRIGATNRRRLIVAKVTPQGLQSPKNYRTTSPLYGRCEASTAVFDTDGRLWLAFLKPRLPRSGWDVFVTCFSGSSWQPPIPISAQKGMDRRPFIALDDSRIIIAFQADDIPMTWSEVDRTSKAKSDIFLATLDISSAPQATAMALEQLVEPNEPFEAADIRVARGEDISTPTINYKGKVLKLFYGDLHEHSDVSVCNRLGDQSIDESYQHMRDIVNLDFACTTDHGYNINPYLWNYTAKLARANDDPNHFLTFLAEEWTSSFEKYNTKHPYGYYGHRNLIFANTYFPRWWNSRNGQTPAQVWEELRKMNANFIHIPHQLADTGNVPTDWNFSDEEAQPVAEIFQVRGSYEYKGAPREAKRSTPKPGYFIQDAWARGIVIGVIASPDHGGGMGKACVYAPNLTRESILNAIRARHCFGTTAARIFLDCRVNGYLMGEKILTPAGKSVEVKINVHCPTDIDRIEVCRNNSFIYSKQPKGRSAEFTFLDKEPLDGRSYYYVRVIQKDGEIAWSSPVWFGADS